MNHQDLAKNSPAESAQSRNVQAVCGCFIHCTDRTREGERECDTHGFLGFLPSSNYIGIPMIWCDAGVKHPAIISSA